MFYTSWPRWQGLIDSVPHVPAPPETKVTLQAVEQLRRQAWVAAPFVPHKGVNDWDPVEKRYPAGRHGTCRHKAWWLADRLGGVVLYGRRTDRPRELHAVLWIKRGAYGFIVDRDGIWPEQSAPFIADASCKAYRP